MHPHCNKDQLHLPNSMLFCSLWYTCRLWSLLPISVSYRIIQNLVFFSSPTFITMMACYGTFCIDSMHTHRVQQLVTVKRLKHTIVLQPCNHRYALSSWQPCKQMDISRKSMTSRTFLPSPRKEIGMDHSTRLHLVEHFKYPDCLLASWPKHLDN